MPEPTPLPALIAAMKTVARYRDAIRRMTDEDIAGMLTDLGLTITVDLDAQTVALGYRLPYAVLFG